MAEVTPRRTYQDFEIHIQGGPDTFDVTATGGDLAARSPLRYDWRADPLTKKVLQELRPTGLEPSLLREFGHKLFDVLFQEETRSLFYHLKDQTLSSGQGLKLLLRVDDPGLAALPWEYLWDPRVEGFVAIDPETPLVRYVVPPEPLPPFPIEAPLRVLVVISNPGEHNRDLYVAPLDVQAEQEKLQQALAELTGAGLVQLRFLHDEEQATPRAIRRLMRDLRPHVFHFIGHGGYEETEEGEGRPFLILETEDQSPRRIDGEEFRAFFVGFNETKLVILNACDTTRMVPKLVNEGIAAVVAMQQPVTDDVAASFSEEFYQALAFNNPISAAVSETRRAIYQDFPSFPGTWGFPVVFLTDRQGVVFDLRSPTRAVEHESVVSPAETLADIADAQTERGDFLGALETTQKIENRDLQGRVMAYIAERLAQAGEIDRALEVAEGLGPADASSGFSKDYRSQALAGIADAQVGKSDFAAALRTVQKIEHPDTRGRVMAHVVEQLATAGEIQRALEVAVRLGPAGPSSGFAEDYRSRALASIAEAQANSGDLSSALDTAEKIEDDDVRSRIKTRIASELTRAGETGAALQVAEAVGDQDSRAELRLETTQAPVYEVIAEQKKNAEDRATLSAPRIWFYMATGDDQRQVNLLAQRDALSWGANPNTRAGDLVLMYRTAPYSDFAYLFRAQSDAREAQQTESWPWSHAVELGDKVPLERPVTLAQVRAHPRLADWNLAQIPRGAMRRAADVRAEGYWEPLRGLLVAWNPKLASTLANWERQSQADLLAEALAMARGIEDEKDRAGALSTLASYLSPSLSSSEAVAALLRNNRLPADEALPVLKQYLTSNPDSVAAFLAVVTDEALSESQRWVALNAVLQAGYAKDVALKPALLLLQDARSSDMGEKLMDVLDDLGDGDPAAPARRVLSAGQLNSAGENLAAVYALARIGTSAAATALTAGLTDGRIAVHQAAVRALQGFEAAQVTPILLAALGQRPQALEGLLSLLDPSRPEHEEVQAWLINLLEAPTVPPSSVAL